MQALNFIGLIYIEFRTDWTLFYAGRQGDFNFKLSRTQHSPANPTFLLRSKQGIQALLQQG
jgi:hypothetical protein